MSILASRLYLVPNWDTFLTELMYGIRNMTVLSIVNPTGPSPLLNSMTQHTISWVPGPPYRSNVIQNARSETTTPEEGCGHGPHIEAMPSRIPDQRLLLQRRGVVMEMNYCIMETPPVG